jgi:hypothetical protein
MRVVNVSSGVESDFLIVITSTVHSVSRATTAAGF